MPFTTLWKFPNRGNWSTHKGDYPGNWSPYIPQTLIKKYSNINDVILDPFIGSGTTAIESLILNRNIIGLDINTLPLEITAKRLKPISSKSTAILRKCDACDMKIISNKSIDFICTHPPYQDIIKYSENIVGDISLQDHNTFLDSMDRFSRECHRVLKKNKYVSFMMGDKRSNGHLTPLAFESMNIFIHIGFELKEIIIKEQFNCSSTYKWTKFDSPLNFFLIAHEYIFIFKKISD